MVMSERFYALIEDVKAIMAERDNLAAENKRLRNENLNLADDLNYHKAILDGSWPTSKQILEQALKETP